MNVIPYSTPVLFNRNTLLPCVGVSRTAGASLSANYPQLANARHRLCPPDVFSKGLE